jgi:hypothetical protein
LGFRKVFRSRLLRASRIASVSPYLLSTLSISIDEDKAKDVREARALKVRGMKSADEETVIGSLSSNTSHLESPSESPSRTTEPLTPVEAPNIEGGEGNQRGLGMVDEIGGNDRRGNGEDDNLDDSDGMWPEWDLGSVVRQVGLPTDSRSSSPLLPDGFIPPISQPLPPAQQTEFSFPPISSPCPLSAPGGPSSLIQNAFDRLSALSATIHVPAATAAGPATNDDANIHPDLRQMGAPLANAPSTVNYQLPGAIVDHALATQMAHQQVPGPTKKRPVARKVGRGAKQQGSGSSEGGLGKKRAATRTRNKTAESKSAMDTENNPTGGGRRE